MLTSSKFNVHPTLIHGWKKQLLAGAENVFSAGAKAAAADSEGIQAELYEQIGRLKMELEWLKKKKLPLSADAKRLRELVIKYHYADEIGGVD